MDIGQVIGDVVIPSITALFLGGMFLGKLARGDKDAEKRIQTAEELAKQREAAAREAVDGIADRFEEALKAMIERFAGLERRVEQLVEHMIRSEHHGKRIEGVERGVDKLRERMQRVELHLDLSRKTPVRGVTALPVPPRKDDE